MCDYMNNSEILLESTIDEGLAKSKVSSHRKVNSNKIINSDMSLETHKKVGYLFFKRFFDVVISLVGIIPLVICAIIIKIFSIFMKDFNSIFFKQERIGRNGNKIYIYKFRSMVPDAENVLERLMEENPQIKKEYLTNKKLENDPRVTPIGKFIRKLSIDELPQLLNVLKGDMSLVGPRPYLFREKKDMKKYYKYVITCKPGITGLWQVSGRSDIGFDDRLKLDKKYSFERNLLYDTKILFKTFAVVFKRKGAK